MQYVKLGVLVKGVQAGRRAWFGLWNINRFGYPWLAEELWMARTYTTYEEVGYMWIAGDCFTRWWDNVHGCEDLLSSRSWTFTCESQAQLSCGPKMYWETCMHGILRRHDKLGLLYPWSVAFKRRDGLICEEFIQLMSLDDYQLSSRVYQVQPVVYKIIITFIINDNY